MKLYDYQGGGIHDFGSVYAGKKLSVLGDSISTFTGFVPAGNAVWYTGRNNGVSSVDDTWWMKLIKGLGMELSVNNSWSGSRVTTTDGNAKSGCDSRCEALGDAPDVIIVYMGINDFNNGVALGTYDGQGDFPAVTTGFREAYAVMLHKILTGYPGAEVWVCTLPSCERTGENTFPEVNGNGVTLDAWNEAIRDLAALFGVHVLEFGKSGLTYQNMNVYMGDYASGEGLHPNAAGHSLLANQAIRQMDPGVKTRY